MSIRKDGRVVRQHPTGVGIVQASEGGPQRMTCPTHKLACTSQQGPKGLVWTCPRGHTISSTPMR